MVHSNSKCHKIRPDICDAGRSVALKGLFPVVMNDHITTFDIVAVADIAPVGIFSRFVASSNSSHGRLLKTKRIIVYLWRSACKTSNILSGAGWYSSGNCYCCYQVRVMRSTTNMLHDANPRATIVSAICVLYNASRNGKKYLIKLVQSSFLG